jgi:DNA-binding SARP family transcriptional activator
MTNSCRISLFGKFSWHQGQKLVTQFESSKIPELLCYLLLYRHRPHSREMVASLLWGEFSTARSKQYLRKTLWQLQTVLGDADDASGRKLLLADTDWLEINANADLWLDVALFEAACAQTRSIPAQQLEPADVARLAHTVQLYQGDLLEGWYQDWCLIERERLQQMFLEALDKLMIYHAARGELETSLGYGSHILRYDRAREHTHRLLMQLYYRMGNRTAALRQYQKCKVVLEEELSVTPAASTTALYKQICADQLAATLPIDDNSQIVIAHPYPISPTLQIIRELQTTLTLTQNQLEQCAQSLERLVNNQAA